MADSSSTVVPSGPPLHLYLTGFQHPNRHIRVLAMSIMFHLMCLRSLALFKREILAALACLMLTSYWLDCSLLLLLVAAFTAVHVWCWWQAVLRVEHIRGHRAGAHGYTGAYCENTIEAMQALVAEDNGPQGPVKDLHYIEIDIQETADGELIVLHDRQLARTFPETGPNIEAYRQLCQESVRWPGTAANPKDLTIAQLRTLHVGGRQGLHAPTLEEFIRAFQACGCRRPLIVEVKALQSDIGRLRLLELLRLHKPYADRLAQEFPQYRNPQLGFLAVIAFPQFYTACFGEFGSKQWKHWTGQLRALGVPVRCCFLEVLSYGYGLSSKQ